MYRLKFNLDPTIPRVCLIAILLMAELILVKLVEILSTQRLPTNVEVVYIVTLGLLQLVTYLLTFLKKEEV